MCEKCIENFRTMFRGILYMCFIFFLFYLQINTDRVLIFLPRNEQEKGNKVFVFFF